MPKILKALLAISILLLAAVYLSSIGKQDQPAQFFIGARNQPPTQKPQNKIFQITNPELTNLPGRWAMAVKNLKSDETYLLRADEKFPAASLYKLAVMWKAYEALEKNQLTPDEILSADKITLDKIVEGKQDKETPETPQETVSLTVENALRAAITVSDNYSAILLAQKLVQLTGLKDVLFKKEEKSTEEPQIKQKPQSRPFEPFKYKKAKELAKNMSAQSQNQPKNEIELIE
ncbi:MAG: Beta-lactamase [Microgenomates group bacterium Gr01-1014_93]|nr:MAG: Beta-lactamase [Microgenomates group bacterium Gr01-1014_93]